MKFRTKIFDPSCTSVTTMMDAHKLIGKTAGLNEQPCLKASLGVTCRCCLQFLVSGYDASTRDPSNPDYADAEEFCTSIVGQVVTLAPSADTQQPQSYGCIWFETQESIDLRGHTNPFVEIGSLSGYPQYWAWAAYWAEGVGLKVGNGADSLGQWESGPSGGIPCNSLDPVIVEYQPLIGETPFINCSNPTRLINKTLSITGIQCNNCAKGMSKYRSEYPEPLWTLVSHTCDKPCVPSGTCRPWTPSELQAVFGDVHWRGIPTDPPQFLNMSCRCD